MSTTVSPTNPRQRIGLVLAGILSVVGIVGVFQPTPEGEVGPPLSILVLGAGLGVIGLVAVIIAWRSGSRLALRVAAGTLIIGMLTALPAFFVDVSSAVKLLVGIVVVLTVASIVLMFSSARRPVDALS